MSNKTKLGLSLAFMTALISGMSNFANKLAVTNMPALTLTSLKNSIVFFMILAVGLLYSKHKKLKDLKKSDIIKLFLIGIIGGTLPFYLFFTGLSQMPAINAALIHKTLIIWIALLAVPLLKEKFNSWHLTAIVLLFGSNFVIGGFQGFNFSSAELMILAATILWAVENIIAKITLKNVDPIIVAGARMGIGSAILWIFSMINGQWSIINSLSLSQLSLIGVTAVFLFAYVITWYSALKQTSAINVASILVSATVFTNILSALFITHSFSIEQFYQSVLISSGLAFLLWGNHEDLQINAKNVTLRKLR